MRAFKQRGLCKEYVAQGMQHFKMKVGAALEDDMRRAAIIREEIGDDRKLMMDGAFATASHSCHRSWPVI